MKKTSLFLLAGFVLAMTVSCSQAPKADKVTGKAPKKSMASTTAPSTTAATAPITEGEVTLAVNTAKSLIKWIGTKPTGQHNGTIQIKDGTFELSDGNIKSGSFEIDMTSVAAVDMDEENNGKLAGHLKNADFFDVEKYPTAKFELTGIEKYKASEKEEEKPLLAGATHIVEGNLTIKDKTKNISFPAIVSITPASLGAATNFNIDRTDWGLTYGSDKSLGDRFIRPEVNLNFELIAKRKL